MSEPTFRIIDEDYSNGAPVVSWTPEERERLLGKPEVHEDAAEAKEPLTNEQARRIAFLACVAALPTRITDKADRGWLAILKGK